MIYVFAAEFQSSAKSSWVFHHFFTILFLKKKVAICIFLQVILLVLINSDFNKKKLEGSPYKLERQV